MRSDRPNVLWICTDQQRYDTIHALGNRSIRTPNLDRLCREGTAFSHVYCQSPICTPSRGSFMTGLYPSAIHSVINGNRRLNLPEGATLISRHFADHRYTCGLVGKLHLASPWEGHEQRIDDGYQEFFHSLSPGQLMDSDNAYTDWLAERGMLDAVLDQSERDDVRRTGVHYRENVPFEWHQTSWCATTAIDFIERRSGTPRFISVNPFDPHPPADAPADFRSHYETSELPPPLFAESDLEVQRRLAGYYFQTEPRRPDDRHLWEKASYYGEIELIDRNVGRLLDALEECGERENTIVIFMSDHGETLGDHGLTLKGCRFYEGLVRVPLIVSWPGVFQKGVVAEGLVELTDIAPTLAEVIGAPMEWTQGRSLLPILLGRASPDRHRDFVRCEYQDALNDSGSYATMYREARYKLSVYHGIDYGELYDLERDPDEFDNLWENPAYRDIKHRLTKASFDASMVIADSGSKRIGRF